MGHEVSRTGYVDNVGHPGADLPNLMLRLEQDGEILGEWCLSDTPLTLNVVDPSTDRVVATLAAELPPEDFSQGVPTEAGQPVLDDQASADGLSKAARSAGVGSDHLSLRDLQRVDPERVEHSTTQEAPLVGSEDTISAPRMILPGVMDSVTAKRPQLDQLATRSMPGLGEEVSEALPELSLDVEGPESESVEGVDDLHLSIRGSGRLSRNPGDDFTMPLPVQEQGSQEAGEATGELGDSLTADLIEVEGRAEVWSRRAGEWVLKGTLVPGQRARMKEGSVKCLQDGGLVVSPGPIMRGTVDVPGGEKVSMKPGDEPRSFPAGAAVTLWCGGRALHVRSDHPMVDVAPVEYHSSRSRNLASYTPPRSDLESTGHGEI